MNESRLTSRLLDAANAIGAGTEHRGDVRNLLREASARIAALDERLHAACDPCAECGHVDWRELDDICEREALGA